MFIILPFPLPPKLCTLKKLSINHSYLFFYFCRMQALYVLIWYLRRRCRGLFKQSFAIPSVSPPIELRDDLFRDSPGSPGPSISSLKRSGMRNSPDDPVKLNKLFCCNFVLFLREMSFLAPQSSPLYVENLRM